MCADRAQLHRHRDFRTVLQGGREKDTRRSVSDGIAVDYPVTHLFPGVNAMAVGAEQFKVVEILCPVVEPPVPGVVLVTMFAVAVQMIDIQYSNIVIATADALATEGSDNFLFALPEATLVLIVAVLVPVTFLAFLRTEFGLTWFAANGTRSGSAPAVSMVARHAAVLGPRCLWRIERLAAMQAGSIATILGAIGGQTSQALVPGWTRLQAATARAVLLGRTRMKRLLAVWAGVFHVIPPAFSIPQFIETRYPGYFEIAKKRIEQAQMQIRLPLEFEQ